MKDLYTQTTLGCSALITRKYSTSFTLGIKTLDKRFHDPIYAIYGFVRLADEIVDTFHDHDKQSLLSRFRNDTYTAITERISVNPVLHAFQSVVHEYSIDHSLIDAFLKSMEMDLDFVPLNTNEYHEYIYGSAEVVGLMCLKVFCEGNQQVYDHLKAPARSLGAAFQKVNFLRDMKSDFVERGRVYFPGVDFTHFELDAKKQIEEDIAKDFRDALNGIRQLPSGARGGVYLAYIYYLQLFKKIKRQTVKTILKSRIRIPDGVKILLLGKTLLFNRINLL